MKEPLYLLDGYGLIYRSYFAFINNPLYNPAGENASAVFGFFRTLLAFINRYNSKYFAVIMDSRVPTFRHEKYPEYKANREKTPQDLHRQIPVIEEILRVLGIAYLSRERYEADDLIASLADVCIKDERSCYIITGDKDMFQLVGSNVKIIRPEKGEYILTDSDGVFAKYGVYPDQVADYLSLTGDKADNIPGVMGIGPKAAASLLDKYQTLDNIYSNLDAIPEGKKKKLTENRKNAYLSRDLVTLCKDLLFDRDIESFSIESLNKKEAIPLFIKQGARSIAKQLDTENVFEFQKEAGSAIGTLDNKPGIYTSVTSITDLDKWVKKVKAAGWFSFDIETDNIDEMYANPVGFSIACKSGEACYIPLRADGKVYFNPDAVKERLVKILEDPKLKWIGQNIKYDYKVLKQWGITPCNIAFDTMIAAWLLDSGSMSFSMDSLAERILDYRTIHYNEVVPKGSTFETVALDKASEYASEDADITYRLYTHFSKQLAERKMENLFYNIEMPLIKVLAEMELKGICILPRKLKTYGQELEKQLKEIETEIYTLCGKEFNINSTKQLQEILFVDRKLKPVKKTKTGYSTDITVLKELSKDDPVPGIILRNRTLSKLKSTYVDALPKMINPKTGRIHTNFIQTGTATGRLSSKEPNLQNIPIKEKEGRRIRDAFVPEEGFRYLSADYSQIELVVLAHLSEDPELKKAFLSEEDVHRQTGASIFGISAREVSADQRRIAKTINFGVMYGMSAFRLAGELKIPRNEADHFIKSYFLKYKKVKEFIDDTVAESERTGITHTLLGRERRIPGINSRNRTEKMGAARIAVNTPIQGSAADIVKISMLKIDRRFKKEHINASMILQVHDELIFEVPENELELVGKIVKEEMESSVKLDIPLRVAIETGKSWGEMHYTS